ncbi:FAD-dependent oxidoreductase [Nocardia thailandica]
MTSYWFTEAELPARLPLPGDARVDTLVIGAGLVGLSTAQALAAAGHDVAVIEARRVGAVTSGATTAKISALQGTRAQTIAKRHDVAVLSRYLAANLAGLDHLLDFCAGHDIAAQRVPAITYAQNESERGAVRAEYEATRAGGLPTELVDDCEVPFPTAGAVRLREQAQVDPVAVLAALAADVEARGAPVHESTRARRLRRRHGRVEVETEHGTVSASTVVVATGIPVFDRGLFFARLTPQRSYLAAFDVPGPIPAEMYLSAGSPTRSLRRVPTDTGEVLFVGGSGHTVGRTRSAAAHVNDLLDWTERWFPGARLLDRWSAQDYHPVGELPWAGPLLPGTDDVLVATGLAKWGMAAGAAAATVLADRVLGRRSPEWAEVFTVARPAPGTLVAGAQANLSVARQMTTGWLSLAGHGAAAGDPPEGAGRVERRGAHPTAVCTVDGETTAVSAVCPHLRGILAWNDAEKTWDCPLHGSRFAPDGAVLEGPATTPLPRR